MSELEIGVARLHPDAQLPKRGTALEQACATPAQPSASPARALQTAEDDEVDSAMLFGEDA